MATKNCLEIGVHSSLRGRALLKKQGILFVAQDSSPASSK
jgi:hypothetical protein